MPIKDPISRTALLTAAARARESRRPDRLFDDPLAETLAGAEGFALMAELEAIAAGENPYIAMRTRFFDDFLARAVSESNARQIVLLAAGLDTRAFRIDWPAGSRLFELDRPELLEAKQRLLDRAAAHPRCVRQTVGVDLTEEWNTALVSAGFDAQVPSVWLVEGLLPYLDERAAASLIARTAGISASGSRLGCDIVGRTFLESPFTQRYLQALEREGAPWKFGTDQPEDFLAARGWRATVTRPGESGMSFGRWPYQVFPRNTPGIPSFFVITAVRSE